MAQRDFFILRDELKKQEENFEKLINDLKQSEDHFKYEREKVVAAFSQTARETENLKSEVITVIGIFAAIMLAFVGGMGFTSSTLANMHQVTIYKAAFISTICGFVIFNTNFSLMYIISRLTQREIYSKCNDAVKGTPRKECCETDYWGVTKIRKRLPYIFWVNFTLLMILILTVACWFLDIKAFAGQVHINIYGL